MALSSRWTKRAAILDALGVARDVIVTDGIRYRYYEAGGFSPVAYANLVNLKQSSARLFEKLRRP